MEYDDVGGDEDDEDDESQSIPTESLPSSAQNSFRDQCGLSAPPSHRAAPSLFSLPDGSGAAAQAADHPSHATEAAPPKPGPVNVATHVELQPSIFPHRPPTIYFDRPPGLAPRDSLQTSSSGGPTSSERMRVPVDQHGPRSLCMRIEKNANSVRHAFKRAGFTVNANREAVRPLVCWSRHSGDKLWTELPLGSRVNHFPGSWTLGRKDGLARILSDQQKRLGGTEYSFVPRTFALPGERAALERALDSGQLQGGGTFIVKPLNSSRGRGIFITSDIDELEYDAKLLVQEYIAHPYLLPQMPNKFDLRIYVLVTSFEPLRAYTFDQGLARFATQPYVVPSADDLGERCAHLTNYSINKKDGDYVANADADDDSSGHKWSLAACFRALAENGVDVPSLRKRIDAMLAKTLIAAQTHVTQKYAQHFRRRGACFELFGFDVMLDADVRPWLIEVNVSPDLASTSPLDRQLKGTLASDVLHLIGVQPSAAIAAAAGAVVPEAPRHNEPPILGRHAHGNRHIRDLEAGVPLASLSAAELQLLVEAEEEWSRAAATGFRRIYPQETAGAQARLAKLFEHARYADALLSSYARRPNRVHELREAVDSVMVLDPPPSSANASATMGGLPPRPTTAAATSSAAAHQTLASLRASGHGQRPRTAAVHAAHLYSGGSGGANSHSKVPRRSSSSRSGARAAAARRSVSPSHGRGGGGRSRSPHKAKASSARVAATASGGGGAAGCSANARGGLSVSGAGLRPPVGSSASSTTPTRKDPLGQAGRGFMGSAGGARPQPGASNHQPPHSASGALPFATGAIEPLARPQHRPAPAFPLPTSSRTNQNPQMSRENGLAP